ncbi:aminotransferase [Limobrevibacterium gyesilva]|uniref:aspartate transaminase n=1 Tax=Limobrevibacterium gyesilva TaxID=2991712 RepID=A0AA41YTH4_9PROT|nr:aminotransferase [Limobrevibacterium gyesilva]MCW3476185.1 aminotransferase [Limobrevibacterium gyesilva]
MPFAPVVSPLVRATGAPPIPAARVWAARYDGRAGPEIDLTQAVPGYPPHADLLQRLARAAGTTDAAGYGPIDGDAALREALAADLASFYGAPLHPDDVAITAGCNLAFGMAMTVAAAPGDSVLLPAPWYFNHHMALTMHGIETVPLPCRPEDGFIPDPDRAAALIDARTRAIVLVTPNNPTGAIYPADTIARFAALCRARGLWLVLDETYRDFLPAEATPPHTVFADPAWRDSVVHLYSFSKSYCVPGHRVGAIVAGGAFRAEMMKVLDTMQICPPRAAQSALAWAIEALRDWRDANRTLMAGRAAAFRTAVSQLQGWRLDALGAYFAYLRLPEGGPDAAATAERLAAEQGLATLPGPFFGPGQQRHLRLAFANVDLPAIAAVPARLVGLHRG